MPYIFCLFDFCLIILSFPFAFKPSSFSSSLPLSFVFGFHPYPLLPPLLTLAPPSPCLLLLLSTCPEPSAPPQDIKCGPSSSTSLLVSWRPPPVESQNGALAGYTVRYHVTAAAGSAESAAIAAAAAEETSGEVSAAANEEQVLLQRLEKWTQYRISVAAFTLMGLGPESELLSCRTDEDGTPLPILNRIM